MKSWLVFAIGGLLLGVTATAIYNKLSEPAVTEVSSASPVSSASAVPAAAEQPAPSAEPAAAPTISSARAQAPSPPGQSCPYAAPPDAPANAARGTGSRVDTITLGPDTHRRALANAGDAGEATGLSEFGAELATPPPPPAPPARVAKTVTIAEGTLLAVRVGERISTETHQPGNAFTATLDQPLVVDGFVIAEKGSRVEGKVLQSLAAGRVKGLAQLEIGLTQLTTADSQKIPIKTADFIKEGEKSTRDDATKVGIGAAIGTAIGAIAGGGKGAAIGAAAGAGAGTGAVLATRGKAAEIPVETRLTFRLAEAVNITERLK